MTRKVAFWSEPTIEENSSPASAAFESLNVGRGYADRMSKQPILLLAVIHPNAEENLDEENN
jgi:hypothetical protein